MDQPPVAPLGGPGLHARVLIVAEALHPSARADLARLLDSLTTELTAVWPASLRSAILSADAPRFEF